VSDEFPHHFHTTTTGRNENKCRQTWSLSVLYAVTFTEIGVQMPFMPVWLDKELK
jgi:hypothetical protein